MASIKRIVDVILKYGSEVIMATLTLYAFAFAYVLILGPAYSFIPAVKFMIPVLTVLVSYRVYFNDKGFLTLNKKAKQSLAILQEKLDSANLLQYFAAPNKELAKSNDLNIAYKMVPCDLISGDIFGIYSIDDSETLIWVGDVVGHGVAAGLVMVSIQSIIQTLLNKNDGSYNINEILIDLNNILYDTFNINPYNIMYNTSFILMKYKNNSLSFVGQHESIIHYSAKTKLFSVYSTLEYGINLGINNDDITKFIHNAIFKFDPGDIIMLYSDGVIECKDKTRDQNYGINRLLTAVKREFYFNNKTHVNNAAIINNIFTDLRLWRGSEHFDDDVSLIMIQNIKKD